jgi:hypothetical protein
LGLPGGIRDGSDVFLIRIVLSVAVQPDHVQLRTFLLALRTATSAILFPDLNKNRV